MQSYITVLLHFFFLIILISKVKSSVNLLIFQNSLNGLCKGLRWSIRGFLYHILHSVGDQDRDARIINQSKQLSNNKRIY